MQLRCSKSIIETFPGGITVYDKDFKLTLANSAYYDLLCIPRDAFPPGSNLEDVIRYHAQQGEYGEGDIEEKVAARLAMARSGGSASLTRTTLSGRVLEVSGWTLDDGGIVTTHIDVTERHDMINDLRAKNREAKQIALQLESARKAQADTNEHLLNSINSMQNGFAIWSRKGILVLANGRISQLLCTDCRYD